VVTNEKKTSLVGSGTKKPYSRGSEPEKEDQMTPKERGRASTA
jgi:hypothetical protein